MGLMFNGASVLKEIVKNHSYLNSIITLGRQKIGIKKNDIQLLFDKPLSHNDINSIYETDYAENFLKYLNLTSIHSLDYSNYEDSNFIHNLNKKIPKNLENKFDIVYDGGTLEHVFNFPIALENCFKMLKPNGFFITHTPINYMCHHGFYQFSPDLYISLCNLNKSLSLKHLFLFKSHAPYSKKYKLKSNITFKGFPINFLEKCPYMCVSIQKLSETQLNLDLIQMQHQGDSWNSSLDVHSNKTLTFINSLPKPVDFFIKRIYQKFFVHADPSFFEKITAITY